MSILYFCLDKTATKKQPDTTKNDGKASGKLIFDDFLMIDD